MSPQALTVRPSRYLLLAGSALHLMALIAAGLSALSPAGTAAVVCGVVLSYSVFATSGWRPTYTCLEPRDGVMTLRGGGRELPVSKPVVCFMAAATVLLRFCHREAGRRQRAVHLLLLPDSLSPEHRRSLHQYLGGWTDAESALH